MLKQSRRCVGSARHRKALISTAPHCAERPRAWMLKPSSSLFISSDHTCEGAEPGSSFRTLLDSGGGSRGAASSHKPTLLATFWSELPALRMEICLACPAMHDGKFSPPLSRHPWLFCFILCAASYFILSTSFPSLHRYYRHAKAGWEGHNDLCFMLLPRLLRGTEGETLLLTTSPHPCHAHWFSPPKAAPAPLPGTAQQSQLRPIQPCIWMHELQPCWRSGLGIFSNTFELLLLFSCHTQWWRKHFDEVGVERRMSALPVSSTLLVTIGPIPGQMIHLQKYRKQISLARHTAAWSLCAACLLFILSPP